jgi:NADPH:quinone reductase-like Zn-dependent oxidoreductase
LLFFQKRRPAFFWPPPDARRTISRTSHRQQDTQHAAARAVMKRIQYHRYGGPDLLRLEDFEPATPGPGQIRVLVRAASVNPVDWKIRSGALRLMTGGRFPRAMGSDFAGIVDAVGPGVTQFRAGDAVLGSAAIKAGGAFAEAVVTEAARAIAKPPSLSFEQAATLPIVGATAWGGLVEKAHLQPGQSVFVHACLGSVGRAAVQLAQMLGAHVAGSARGTAMAEARALGVDPVLDFQNLDLSGLRNRFDIVFDTAGTLSLSDGRALLKRGGVILDIAPSPAKALAIFLSPSRKLLFANPTSAVLASITEAAEAGKWLPVIGGAVQLSAAIPALAVLEQQGLPKGKLVIVMNDA